MLIRLRFQLVSRSRWVLLLASVLSVTLGLSNCAGRTYKPVVRYSVNPKIETPRVEATEKLLAIRPLEAAQPYKLKIVYRESDYVLGNYPDVEWAELPRDVVTRALQDALSSSGRFRDVGLAGNLGVPDLILTGQLRRFEEVRAPEGAVALCEVRLELREAIGGKGRWTATLSAKEPLQAADLPSLAAAMSRAVEKVVQESVVAICKQ